MRHSAAALAFALILALPVAGFAQTRYVSDLTQGALLGPVTSSAQLQTEFVRNGALIAQASTRLGLSASEYGEVRDAVALGLAQYVVLPRHLDGMSGEYHGVAFAVHDIDIPAGVHGWEVDVVRPNALVRVFVPNSCGNVSYLIVPRREQLAAAPRREKAPAPLALWDSANEAAALPNAGEPAPAEDIAAAPPIAPAVASRSSSFLPMLAMIPLAFLGGGGSVSIPIGAAPPVPVPAAHHPVGILLHMPIVTPTSTPCPPPLRRAFRLPSRPE
ncbi:MAG: hypothetical protein JO199_13185 [Candidatus Eremiobacteraeota bacterium]|nr:hypothetical protein [Candidatus Eremiobacteraeota bacterium]